MNHREHLESITRSHTAFPTFAALLNAEGGYSPSLRVSDAQRGSPITEIADAYDAAQQKRGDPRRAFRT